MIFQVNPWISWQDTHSNYGRIMYITRFMVSLTPMWVICLSINWWALVLSGFTFFPFFGLGEEAMKQYRFWIRCCLRPFGIEYSKEESRGGVKRTWVDVLLRRPGRPVLSKSGPGYDIGHFSVDPAETRLSDYENASSQSRDIGNVAASSNPNTLGSARVNSEHSRIPLHITRSMVDAAHVSQHRVLVTQTDIPSPTESDVPNEKLSGGQYPPLASTEMVDLEVQQGPGLSVEEQRRKEILERNPELTEEVFF